MRYLHVSHKSGAMEEASQGLSVQGERVKQFCSSRSLLELQNAEEVMCCKGSEAMVTHANPSTYGINGIKYFYH